MKKTVFLITALALSINMMAEDHVLAATHGSRRDERLEAPDTLTLSLAEAQNYAIKQNRSLKNASLAVQEAYAARWQTIAAMLPQVDGTIGKTIMYDDSLRVKTVDVFGPPMSMSPWTFNAQVAIGFNGQGIVGALLKSIAIDMKKLSLEQSESQLRGNVMSMYVSVLALQSISNILDSSLVNIQGLEAMTQKAVEAGASEQTAADQIRVRVNNLKNSINAQQRSIVLAYNSLKVLLDVPVETTLVLTEDMAAILSPERVITLLSENFAIENNLNYQLLQKQVEIAKANVHLAGWAYGPTVSAYGQYTKRVYGKGETGFEMMSSPYTVGLTVSVPIWSSGKRAAGVIEKQIALEEAKNTLSETTDNLQIQYRQLCFNLTNAYETYVTEKENKAVSERIFASSTNKFKYGAASNLELTNASNDLLNANSAYIQAILSLVNAQVELENFLNN